eukprot:TRINITY_DN7536_c0_g1_i1.p1 TRINITY_DN7536_c0_g1~~TRINITY_DN7536_c0_g1_i1.p1  ORF type:complete len:105 (-),score=16.82 TRINITY_DN7536_c0_g1_i1:74-388(-)
MSRRRRSANAGVAPATAASRSSSEGAVAAAGAPATVRWTDAADPRQSSSYAQVAMKIHSDAWVAMGNRLARACALAACEDEGYGLAWTLAPEAPIVAATPAGRR